MPARHPSKSSGFRRRSDSPIRGRDGALIFLNAASYTHTVLLSEAKDTATRCDSGLGSSSGGGGI